MLGVNMGAFDWREYNPAAFSAEIAKPLLYAAEQPGAVASYREEK